MERHSLYKLFLRANHVAVEDRLQDEKGAATSKAAAADKGSGFSDERLEYIRSIGESLASREELANFIN